MAKEHTAASNTDLVARVIRAKSFLVDSRAAEAILGLERPLSKRIRPTDASRLSGFCPRGRLGSPMMT